MSAARKSRGRQKIEMRKMSNESNLQVTFSKRRSGLFKKASELCTLCGADVVLIVFSPGDKVFSFGHPNVDTVIDRYLTRAPPHNPGTMQFMEVHRTANVRELNGQLTQVNTNLDAEKKRSDNLTRLRKATMVHFWWTAAIEEMTPSQLEQLRVALEELKKCVTRNADRLLIQGAIANPVQLFGASSSNAVVHHHQPLSDSILAAPVPPPPPPMYAPQMLQLQPAMVHQNPMMQNHVFDGSMIRQHGFNVNNMGGYGHPPGFF